MQVESMFTATKHQHFRIISILRAETTTVYLNSEEGESCVCDLAGDWPHFKRYAASFMQAHEHLEEAAATRSRRCPRQPARKPRLRTLWQHRWGEGDYKKKKKRETSPDFCANEAVRSRETEHRTTKASCEWAPDVWSALVFSCRGEAQKIINPPTPTPLENTRRGRERAPAD